VTYISFTNSGIYVFTTILEDKKAFKRRRQVRFMPAPSRKPKYPVPDMGI